MIAQKDQNTVTEIAAGLGRNVPTIMKVFNLKTMEIVELLQENTQKAKEKFP